MRIKCHRLVMGDGLAVIPCGKDATVDREAVMDLNLSINTKHAFYALSFCNEHGEEFDKSPATTGIKRLGY